MHSYLFISKEVETTGKLPQRATEMCRHSSVSPNDQVPLVASVLLAESLEPLKIQRFCFDFTVQLSI